MNVIIYYRKSTDRDDKQANSLEHQLKNCRKTAEVNSLKIYKEIWESRSAKTEWTRPWFNELIKICKTWRIDYIIIDETKRLSRNNIDTSRIIDLLDKKQIKAILGTSREYNCDNSRDKFLLQLDLSLSKMDNEDRAKDIKDKMASCINNTGRFLWKAPFWYKNITIRKWHKDIIVDKNESKIVKEIFSLRLENKAYSTIANILETKYGNKINLNYKANRIHNLVNKTFYYWVFTWNWKAIIWSHKPLITKETFDKANSVWKWVHQQIETIRKREYREYPLKWLIRDSSWIYLTGYVNKGITYYGNQYRSDVKVCLNSNKLFDKIWTIIKKLEWVNRTISEIDKNIILKLLRKDKSNNWSELSNIDIEIKNLKKKQEKLLDLRLDEKINDKIYLDRNNQFENEIKEFLDQKEFIKNDDFEEKTQVMLELAWSLYKSYFLSNEQWKTYIIKNLMLELFVNNKKELQIAESDLFKSSKILNIFFGTPKGFDIRIFKSYLSRIDLEELKEFYKFIKSLT